MTDAISIKNLNKYFGEIQALKNINLTIKEGSLTALCGENGAGKSTLLSVIAGLQSASSGTLSVFDETVRNGRSPNGLGMVHQHFSLVPLLTVSENILLGDEPARYGFFSRHRAREIVYQLCQTAGTTIDPDAYIENLSLGEQQRVELLKALHRGKKILLLDEPTAVLAPHEIDRFLTLLATLKTRGFTLVLVSHKLKEIVSVCDRAVVLRDGEIVADLTPSSETIQMLATAMIGDHHLSSFTFQKDSPAASETLLEVRQLSVAPNVFSRCGLNNVSFEIKSGQILGIAGVDGNGQQDLFFTLTGAQPSSQGRVVFCQQEVTHASSEKRRKIGMRMIPADRQREALLNHFNLYENLYLGNEHLFSIKTEHRSQFASDMIKQWNIHPRDANFVVNAMSGGNQQKLLFARELHQNQKFFIVHDPTRGIDFATRQRLWQALSQLVSTGAAILLISSDLEELFALCTHLAVLYRGRLSPVFPINQINETTLGRLISGIGTEA